MCGLLGYTGKENPNIGYIKLLLLQNMSRGNHSTGVYGKQLYKEAGGADEFIQNATSLKRALKAKAVIGHTRYATGGAHTKENAHPFRYGDIVGTHNGVLSKTKDLADKYGVDNPTVDSMLIYLLLSKNKYNWDIISEIEGDMALAWVYKKNLFLYRRNSRPLYTAKIDNGMYYSSEKEGLKYIGATDSAIKELPPFILHEYKEGILVNTVDIADNEPAPTKSSYSPSLYGGYADYYDDDYADNYNPVRVNQKSGIPKAISGLMKKNEAIIELSAKCITVDSSHAPRLLQTEIDVDIETNTEIKTEGLTVYSSKGDQTRLVDMTGITDHPFCFETFMSDVETREDIYFKLHKSDPFMFKASVAVEANVYSYVTIDPFVDIGFKSQAELLASIVADEDKDKEERDEAHKEEKEKDPYWVSVNNFHEDFALVEKELSKEIAKAHDAKLKDVLIGTIKYIAGVKKEVLDAEMELYRVF